MIRSLGGGIAQACRQALQQTGALPAVQTLRQYAQPADSHKRNLAEASSESSFGNIKIGQVYSATERYCSSYSSVAVSQKMAYLSAE